MRFTLDTNCIIDVEENRPSAQYVIDLVNLHGQNGITVAVSAIGASERQRVGGYSQSFSDFQTKLNTVGLGNLELLPPIGYFGITFFNYCVYGGGNETLENDIHNALFPSIEFNVAEYAINRGLPANTSDHKWRNAKCDVLALWCHVKNQGDVFVTSDDNFHASTKQAKLISLGVGQIALPEDAIKLAKESAPI
jgi:hypothetical protein